jgi:hypothetical protein
MDAANLSGAALLEFVKTDQLRLYANPPAYGSLTFTVYFHENRPVRVGYAAEIQKQVRSNDPVRNRAGVIPGAL